VNNFIPILALKEDEMHSVVFVRPREEGGFSCVFDPEKSDFSYQVFIHSPLPLKTKSTWEFPSFESARSFASTHFKEGWQMMKWDQNIRRPCMDGGHECGSGSCETCQSTGGGCKSCGATDEGFAH
jgi:hypothetical protein